MDKMFVRFQTGIVTICLNERTIGRLTARRQEGTIGVNAHGTTGYRQHHYRLDR
jgi:hypothetical protein